VLDLVNKAYIQVTYVEPYFDRWEALKCSTFFERNYSLSKFLPYFRVYEIDSQKNGNFTQTLYTFLKQ
jgi:hypothetical protein